MKGKFSRVKTKTFGGKIWNNLRSVSHYNSFWEKFEEVTLKKFFYHKNFLNVTVHRKSHQKLLHYLALKYQFWYFNKIQCPYRNKFFQTLFQWNFQRTSRWFFMRGDARVLREMKKMTWQIDQTGDKINLYSKMDFKISQSDRGILFQLTEFNSVSNRVCFPTV